MKKILLAAGLLLGSLQNGSSFCGFYVAKADAKLFNKSSQVIIVRDGKRSIITMESDYQGALKDFAMVVPVPVVLKQRDIKVLEPDIFTKFDDYSGPRLVEYYDTNPCSPPVLCDMIITDNFVGSFSLNAAATYNWNGVGANVVKIEAEYKIDEYDIVILSATESNGLKIWLKNNGYKIPEVANDVLDPYIKEGMKFFLVKVDAEKVNWSDKNEKKLRPLQIAFDSDRFMLPIRLGMANAAGAQDMLVYALSRTGRVESTNYRMVEMPTDKLVPEFVEAKFGQFYKDAFRQAYYKEHGKAVFLEYAWEVTPTWGGMKCDPCVGDPPMVAELKKAGVSWAGNLQGPGNKVFFTRMHIRYDREHFPQDLQFQETPNTKHYQARYVLTHPPAGELECDEGQEYLKTLVEKRQEELDNLVALTGWGDYGHFEYIYKYSKQVRKWHDGEDKGSLWPAFFKGTSKPGAALFSIAVATALTLLFSMLLRVRRLRMNKLLNA